MNLVQWAKDLMTSLIPVQRKTIFRTMYETGTTLPSMTVDRLQSILRAAENGDVRPLFACYRDIISSHSHLQTEFTKRKLAVLGTPLAVEPGNDPATPADEQAAKAVAAMQKGCKGWLRAVSHLLDSALYPVSVVEKIYEPVPGGGYRLRELIPVPYELLDYSQCVGELRIRDTNPETGEPLSTVHVPDPNRYIVHRGHLLSTPDHWGGPLRSLLFWWLFATQGREWWIQFLDRFGTPFLVGKYDSNDDASRTLLMRALSVATRLGGLVISRDTEVELKERTSSSQGGDAFQAFHEVACREMSKLIVGQTLSADAQATGMGSGVADAQEQVREDIRQLDATLLSETFKEQLTAQFCAINGLAGILPDMLWAPDSTRQSLALSTLLKQLKESSMEPTDDAIPVLAKRFGFGIRRIAAPSAPSLPGLPGLPAPGTLPAGGGAPLALPGIQDAAKALRMDGHNVTLPLPMLIALASRGAEDRHEQNLAANDAIINATAPDLARAFRGTLAPIRRIILDSTSPEDCEAKLAAFAANLNAAPTAKVVLEALSAAARNGVIVDIPPPST
ncbi:hypothetical protein DB346_02775 [Verrucomicrobia bacterium LW23]|nr:hypothetical protein DB346_03880 [Verrucomicrobia bacterium LW23]PTY04372.1 hypothetical protein DB346_02775 [Verrucomicrobia bacterium LW23]